MQDFDRILTFLLILPVESAVVSVHRGPIILVLVYDAPGVATPLQHLLAVHVR